MTKETEFVTRRFRGDTSQKKLNDALLFAAARGRTEALKGLLKSGADVNARNRLGNTPLIEAAFGGHTDTLKALLDHGGDPKTRNRNGDTAFTEAARAGHAEAVTALLESADTLRSQDDRLTLYTALMEASMFGRKDVVELLRNELQSHGVEMEIEPTRILSDSSTGRIDPEGEAIEELKAEIELRGNRIHEDGFGAAKLLEAARFGRLEAVRLLLDAGVDPNSSDGILGGAALIEASKAGHTEIVKLLEDRGANVDGADHQGVTGLMEAARAGHVSVARFLLDSGADVNAQENIFGGTALLEAVRAGHERMVRLLLDRDADVNAPDKTGLNALSEATLRGRTQIVRLLRAYGAK